MSAIDNLARQILADVHADFRTKNLGADALSQGYVGPSLTDLEKKYCVRAKHLKVDFDLALKQLEDDGLIKTGPMAPYDNPPDSVVVILTMVNRREFGYLTEKGYRRASNPL